MAEEDSIESQIEVAMASRIPHFRQQSDSLTFEGVRRLLEKDLGLDKYALDVHKRFVKQLLSKFLDGDDDDMTKDSEKTVEKSVSTAGDVGAESESNLADKDVKESNTKEEGKMEESPVMGLLTVSESPETRVVDTEDTPKDESPSEITVKEAMSKRAAYFKANSENVTMAGVRRLLEKDLKLDEFTLDPFKKLIREEIDKVFASKASALSTDNKKKSAQRKTSKKVSSGESSNSSDNGNDDVEEVKPRKKVVRKEKVQTSKTPIKRKRPEKETKVSRKKQNKLAKMTSEEVSGDDGENDPEDGQSHSSEEKPVKKKEVSTAAAYGKGVERLKSIIKACGMSVPPIVYKKAKQVPDDEREDFIVKELEKILEKEGLSRKPDEKDIKEVRKRKERAKELEGIDMSNIVQSSRRRSTLSFIPPPKPKISVDSDADDTENSDDGTDDGTDDENSDEDNSDGDGDVDDNDVEEQNDSQNDEPHEDNEDSD
ncbi:CHZ domain-containing protein [Heracleum sosnowskyi]|uniref:CHZ domain-containing protein n=1 Tax=Heracleum sosnowskyi TaxID=360622 RepID=A0AAD8JI10_9APIA|nr:CHZ domain-containing protein [Heracleum sosnowskyi]